MSSSVRLCSDKPILLQTPGDTLVNVSKNENDETLVIVRHSPLQIEIPEPISDFEEGSPILIRFSRSRNPKIFPQYFTPFHPYRLHLLCNDKDDYPEIKKLLDTNIKNQREVETTVSHSPYGYSEESRPILTGIHIAVLGNYFAGTLLQKNIVEKLLVAFGATLLPRIQSHADVVLVGICEENSSAELKKSRSFQLPEIRNIGTFLSCVFEFAINYATETQSRIQVPQAPHEVPFSFPFPRPIESAGVFHMGVNYKKLTRVSKSKQEKEMKTYRLSDESKQIVQKKVASLTPRTKSI
jgi:hypothetical protein